MAELIPPDLTVLDRVALFQALPGGSQQDPTWTFLTEMHALGFRAAAGWLADNLHAVGTRLSLNCPCSRRRPSPDPARLPRDMRQTPTPEGSPDAT